MKILKSMTAGLLASAILSMPVLAAETDIHELTSAAIELGHRYDSNYAAKNPDAMASLYAEQGVLVSPSGQVVRGRAALYDYYVKRFASGAQGHSIHVKEVHVKGDGGYAICEFSVNVPDAHGALHHESGNLVAIYQHKADGWHLSLIAPSIAAEKHS